MPIWVIESMGAGHDGPKRCAEQRFETLRPLLKWPAECDVIDERDAVCSRSRDGVGALRVAPAEREILAGRFIERNHQVVRRYAGRRGDTGVDVFQECKPRLL